MEKNKILICECHSIEHQIIFSYEDNDPDWNEVYMQIHLNKRTFWERLKYGIKYIFGRQCNYGAFDEVVIKPKDHQKLESVANYLKKIYDSQEKNN